jgi:AcrR family transcriptional regulator
MAYEVTKRVKGRDYRYLVSGYRDPETNKRRARWEYLGVFADGRLQAEPPRRKKRVGAEEIIEATQRLLEYRDPLRVTVSVIINAAGASHSTFYRYFPDRTAVFNAALARICDRMMFALPSLEGPFNTVQEARTRLREWCEALCLSTLQQRALRWALSQGHGGALRPRIERSMMTVDTVATLRPYFLEMNRAGFSKIADVDEVARAIRSMHVALIQARVANPSTDGEPAPDLSDIFPLVDLAVFGSR